jgi:hypothetical protein
MTACSQISYYEAAILCCLLLPFISGKGRGLRAYISGKGGDCDSKSSGKERGLRPYFPGKEGGGAATLIFPMREGDCDPYFSEKGRSLRP